MPSENFVRKLY